ncbi:MAG TPA: tRNA uridine-5-carboxymethylaminomethyl(34) synthesis enzyme MnmG [Deltaproteobacteria bacterium]|nr:tRNA uridine-5-carboxymethylaminomethyl(34) synthesis enzyme MnmG [Deltaproteobacteria bacterium]
MERFDIIVVGGGHAGAEAAYAASKFGISTALFTMNMDTIGRMPCSPSIGGLAKSHLVKEIDSLGGIMARAADDTAIQYRVLNTKKGPSVRSTRTQNDRKLYEAAVKARLETSGIHLRQARVDSIEVDGNTVTGIIDQTGMFYAAKAVIITAGTFLSGTIHIGEKKIPAGRAGEEGAYELSASLAKLGFAMGRHKTGTPPRLHADSIDFEGLTRQDPMGEFMPFSLDSAGSGLEQVPCYMTRTTPETHCIIRENIHRSALYSGAITGIPARYCPSLEDKVMRFGERGGHQVIIEPEGIHTKEVYASGLGNSLPVDLQWKIVHSVPGLEHAEIVRNAYAIEYDYVFPTQLQRTLETKSVMGLYLAGQVNGTSGYEEAAAQGLMAAVNAALKIQGRDPFILDRSQAYIAVMIDDLVTRGTSEPYRMFTSRAEYRLMLRETNALFRLSQTAYSLGLISDERIKRVGQMQEEIRDARDYLGKTTLVIPDDMPEVSPTRGAVSERISMAALLKRPEVSMDGFRNHGLLPDITRFCAMEVEIGIKYEGYIHRQIQEIGRLKEMEKIKIPEDIDFNGIEGLSNELRTRLSEIRPKTLGQAFLIEGMTPAGIQAIRMGIRLSGS